MYVFEKLTYFTANKCIKLKLPILNKIYAKWLWLKMLLATARFVISTIQRQIFASTYLYFFSQKSHDALPLPLRVAGVVQVLFVTSSILTEIDMIKITLKVFKMENQTSSYPRLMQAIVKALKICCIPSVSTDCDKAQTSGFARYDQKLPGFSTGLNGSLSKYLYCSATASYQCETLGGRGVTLVYTGRFLNG